MTCLPFWPGIDALPLQYFEKMITAAACQHTTLCMLYCFPVVICQSTPCQDKGLPPDWDLPTNVNRVPQDHAGKRVDATKRWWTCSGCNNRFTTVGVKYPKKRCPNPRCCTDLPGAATVWIAECHVEDIFGNWLKCQKFAGVPHRTVSSRSPAWGARQRPWLAQRRPLQRVSTSCQEARSMALRSTARKMPSTLALLLQILGLLHECLRHMLEGAKPYVQFFCNICMHHIQERSCNPVDKEMSRL